MKLITLKRDAKSGGHHRERVKPAWRRLRSEPLGDFKVFTVRRDRIVSPRTRKRTTSTSSTARTGST